MAETLEDFITIGAMITAVPVLNAVSAVVAAEPGIITYANSTIRCPAAGCLPAERLRG
ncbi:MAG: hypothetical protein P8J50_19005 [Acidimicrobiales bacterium]|nr:hypothetical protein [Acidimicrobiales bacterium]